MQASEEVIEVLTHHFGELSLAGSGAWSTAFRFRRHNQDLVVRVGEHVSDFAEMSAYDSPSLPIPRVLELDRLLAPHEHLYVCVSTFAPGEPLESVTPEAWVELVPAVADILDAMRGVVPPATGALVAWPQVLLGTNDGDSRHGGWPERLTAQPDQLAGHEEAINSLRELCRLPQVAKVQPTLLHCDLVNRNVHVADGVITGVFDWGCRRWGDHLYDLAWFEFWAPWMPNLDIGLLRLELVRRWGEVPDPDRHAACLLHIGADHLVYNAAIDDPDGGNAVLDRLLDLSLIY